MYFYCYVCVFLFMFMYLHRASWHSSATLTEVFPCFSSVVSQMPGYNSQRRGTARTLPKVFVLFYLKFVLCRSLYCLCVNVYCTTATEWQSNCSSTNISSYISQTARFSTRAIDLKISVLIVSTIFVRNFLLKEELRDI